MTESQSVSSRLYHLYHDSELVEVATGSDFPLVAGVSDFVSYPTAEAASSATALSGTAANGSGKRGPPRKVTGPKSPTEEAQKKEKNRLAARQCRQKKKEQEKRQKQYIRQLQDDESQKQHRIRKLSALYLSCLRHFQTKAAFFEYLKQNPELARDPESKSLLREFMENGFKSLV